MYLDTMQKDLLSTDLSFINIGLNKRIEKLVQLFKKELESIYNEPLLSPLPNMDALTLKTTNQDFYQILDKNWNESRTKTILSSQKDNTFSAFLLRYTMFNTIREDSFSETQTILEAIELIENQANFIAEYTVLNFKNCLGTVFRQDLLNHVIHRQEIIKSWPWPLDNSLCGLLNLLILLLPSLPKGEPHPWQEWPSDITFIEVARWVYPRIYNGNKILSSVEDGREFPMTISIFINGQTNEFLYHRSCVALLYKIERLLEFIAPSPPRVALVAVDRPPVRTMTGMVGSNWNLLESDSEIALVSSENDPTDPIKLEFRWKDGTQLELPIAPDNAGPFLAVAHKYGVASVRNLLVLSGLTWAARASAEQSFWWWPEEHLELANLKDNKDNRKSLIEWIQTMTQAQLIAHYSTGAPICGPLITVSLTDGDAYRLHLHPALFRGVTNEDGRPGKYWWPMPLELLKLPADRTAGKIHILAVLFGSFWRASLPDPVARINSGRLVEYLAIRSRDDRELDRRAAKTLQRTLEAGQKCGLIGDWDFQQGSIERLSATVVAQPGKSALDILKTSNIPKPAWLPATGKDLERWMQASDVTSFQASEILSIPDSTLRRLRSYKERPLPTRVRQAFRSYLWKEPKG